MAFQALHDPAPERSVSSDLGLLLIRLLPALAFFYYQLAAQLRRAADYVWDGTSWELIDELGALGAPSPELAAIVGLGVMTAALGGIVAGLFTRLSALLSLFVVGFLLFTGVGLSTSLVPQTLVLYLSVLAALAFCGGGRLSLDHLLAGRRRAE